MPGDVGETPTLSTNGECYWGTADDLQSTAKGSIPLFSTMSNRTAYIDVDDTLVHTFGSKRIPLTHTIDFVRKLKADGVTLYCWSKAGASYAKATAKELNIEDCFEAFLTKPDVLIDDLKSSKWISKEVHPNACFALTIEELFEK